MTNRRIRRFPVWLSGVCTGLAALPGASQPATETTLVRTDTATFAEIAVEGSSVLDSDEIDALTSPYENRPITFESRTCARSCRTAMSIAGT
jgi:hypothetical protein